MKRIPLILPAIACALLFVSAAFAQVLVVNHELGKTEVPLNPQRVVVFDFGALDTLDKLGVDVLATAKLNLPPYLSKYGAAEYANVGGLTQPDLEAINELKPDLILISARQSAYYPELSRIAPTVYAGVNTSDYVESFKVNMTTLGAIFGKETEVAEALAEIDAAISRVRLKAAGKTALVALVTGGTASTYGPGSRYVFIYDVMGFTPVDRNIVASTHGQNISWEYILIHDPDYILVIDRDAAVGNAGTSPAKQVIENALVKETKAYKNGNIVYLDPYYWYLSGGGLVSFAKMIEDIETALR